MTPNLLTTISARIGSVTRRVVLTAAVLAVPHSAAAAAILDVAGSTAGCFGTSCTDYLLSATSSDFALTFTGVDFAATTSADGQVSYFALGTMTRDQVTNVSSNLGTLPFTLEVTFTLPLGLDGGEGDTFSALIHGQNTGGGGKVSVAFTDPWQTFYFDTASGFGSFEFAVLSEFDLTKGKTGTIYGGIRNASYTSTAGVEPPPADELVPVALPEPASLLLLGTGLAGLVARRRQNGLR